MKYFNTCLIIIALASCKKPGNLSPDPELPPVAMEYRSANLSVVQTDPYALLVDMNDDGIKDFAFYVQLYGSSTGDHLYLAMNGLNGSSTLTGATNDDFYNNGAWVPAQKPGEKIGGVLKEGDQWNGDDALLAIKHDDGVKVVYEGAWGDETEQIAAIKLASGGSFFYGWARIKYTRSLRKLTLIDFAYCKKPNTVCSAGSK